MICKLLVALATLGVFLFLSFARSFALAFHRDINILLFFQHLLDPDDVAPVSSSRRGGVRQDALLVRAHGRTLICSCYVIPGLQPRNLSHLVGLRVRGTADRTLPSHMYTNEGAQPDIVPAVLLDYISHHFHLLSKF